MPRIRKKTSNRSGTNENRKLHNRIRESKKKKAKAAKKSTQWKSKHKKDPGIPSNFPYKDQILAEVAEQRRLAAEEKQAKKVQKKDKKASNQDEEQAEAIAGLAAQRLLNVSVNPIPIEEEDDESDLEDEAPMLVDPTLTNLEAVLNQADVVLEVLDCRDPLPCRSSYLEQEVVDKASKHLLFVLNKIDCCPREAVAGWLSALSVDRPTFLSRSASHFLAGAHLGNEEELIDHRDGLGGRILLEYLRNCAAENGKKSSLSVAVVGVANVGKSSFINSLAQKSALSVYTPDGPQDGPTTTNLPQEICIRLDDTELRFIDTPGYSWEKTPLAEAELATVRARDVLLRNRGKIERLKNTDAAVEQIVSRSNSNDLMLLYNQPFFAQGDSNAFLSGLARSHQLIKKHGDPDLSAASRLLLRDWGNGKFMRYTMPTPTPTTPKDIEERFATVLASLPTRKEMKRTCPLVKLSTGSLETRKLLLHEIYTAPDPSLDEAIEEAQDMYSGGGEPYSDEEDEEDEDEESMEMEEDLPHKPDPPVSRKQKRKRDMTEDTIKPGKKVTFAPPQRKTKSQVSKSKPNGKRTNETPSDAAYDFGSYF